MPEYWDIDGKTASEILAIYSEGEAAGKRLDIWHMELYFACRFIQNYIEDGLQGARILARAKFQAGWPTERIFIFFAPGIERPAEGKIADYTFLINSRGDAFDLDYYIRREDIK